MAIDSQLIHDLLEYYAKPYTNPISGPIARPFHGKLHAASAAHAVELLLALYRKYLKAMPALQAYEQDEVMQELTLLGALCHDIGNTSEVHKNEQDHADIFIKVMTAKTIYPLHKIQAVASAMVNKDASIVKSIPCQFIGDVDRLEYNRLPQILQNPQLFKIEYLEIYKIFDKNGLDQAKKELRQIVDYYLHLSHFLNDCKEIHETLELSQNCFEDVKGYITAYRVWSLIGLEYTPEKLRFPELPLFLTQAKVKIPVLELYNDHIVGKASKRALKLYQELLASNQCIPATKTSVDDLYNGQDRVLIRRLAKSTNKYAHVTDEFIKLGKNFETSMAKAQEFEEKRKPGSPSKVLVDGFIYSPVACKVRGTPQIDYARHASGFTLNAKTTKCYYIYKENALTNNIADAKYDTKRANGIKNMSSIDALVTKTTEMEKRRIGELPDPTAKYLGMYSLRNNELLTDYNLSDITSILVAPNKFAARSAIYKRLALAETHKQIAFYMHHAHREFEPVAEETVLTWAGLKSNTGLLEIPVFEDIPTAHFARQDLAPQYAKMTSTSNLKLNDPSIPMSQWQFTFNSLVKETGKPDVTIAAKTYIKHKMPVVEIGNVIQLDYRGYFRYFVNYEINSILKTINDFFAHYDSHFIAAFGINQLQIVPQTKNNTYNRYFLNYTAFAGLHSDFNEILSKLGLTENTKITDISYTTKLNDFICVTNRIRSLPAIIQLANEITAIATSLSNIFPPNVSDTRWLLPVPTPPKSELQKLFVGSTFSRILSYLSSPNYRPQAPGTPTNSTYTYVSSPNCLLTPLQKFLYLVNLQRRYGYNCTNGDHQQFTAIYYAMVKQYCDSGQIGEDRAKNLLKATWLNFVKYKRIDNAISTSVTSKDVMNGLIVSGAIGLTDAFQNWDKNNDNILLLVQNTRDTTNKIYLFDKFINILSPETILFDIAFLMNNCDQLKNDTVLVILKSIMRYCADDAIYKDLVTRLLQHPNLYTCQDISSLIPYAIQCKLHEPVNLILRQLAQPNPKKADIIYNLLDGFTQTPDIEKVVTETILIDSFCLLIKDVAEELFKKAVIGGKLILAEKFLKIGDASSVNFLHRLADVYTDFPPKFSASFLKTVLRHKLTTENVTGEINIAYNCFNVFFTLLNSAAKFDREIIHQIAHYLQQLLITLGTKRFSQDGYSKGTAFFQPFIVKFAPTYDNLVSSSDARDALQQAKINALMASNINKAHELALLQRSFQNKQSRDCKANDELFLNYVGMRSNSSESKEYQTKFEAQSKTLKERGNITKSLCHKVITQYNPHSGEYQNQIDRLMILHYEYLSRIMLDKSDNEKSVFDLFLLMIKETSDLRWGDLAGAMIVRFITELYECSNKTNLEYRYLGLCHTMREKFNFGLTTSALSKLYYLSAITCNPLNKKGYLERLMPLPREGITRLERSCMLAELNETKETPELQALYARLDQGEKSVKLYSECAELEMKNNLKADATLDFVKAHSLATPDEQSLLNQQFWQLMPLFDLSSRLSLIERCMMYVSDINHPEFKRLNDYLTDYQKQADSQFSHILDVIILRLAVTQRETAKHLDNDKKNILFFHSNLTNYKPNLFKLDNNNLELRFKQLEALINMLNNYLVPVPEFITKTLSLIQSFETLPNILPDMYHHLKLMQCSALYTMSNSSYFSEEERQQALNDSRKLFDEIDRGDNNAKEYDTLKMIFKCHEKSNDVPAKLEQENCVLR